MTINNVSLKYSIAIFNWRMDNYRVIIPENNAVQLLNQITEYIRKVGSYNDLQIMQPFELHLLPE